jgi:hypothetical protein
VCAGFGDSGRRLASASLKFEGTLRGFIGFRDIEPILSSTRTSVSVDIEFTADGEEPPYIGEIQFCEDDTKGVRYTANLSLTLPLKGNALERAQASGNAALPESTK